MLCAQCLLFNDNIESVTQVGGVAVCADHARAMLQGAPMRPLQQLKIRQAGAPATDVAPTPTNDNPPFASEDSPT